MPEFAGTKQKLAVFEVEFKERKPQKVLEVDGLIWSFDKNGKVAESLWREHCARVNLTPGAIGG